MYLYDGLIRDGLHMRIDPDGNLERVLSVDSKHIELPSVNLVDEILNVSETDDRYYVVAVNHLIEVYRKIEESKDTESESKLIKKLLNAINLIVEGLIENNKVLGYLMKQTIEMNWHNTYEMTPLKRFEQLVGMFINYYSISTELEFLLTDLSNGKELDFEERCNVFKYCEIITAYTHTKTDLNRNTTSPLFLNTIFYLLINF